jgi:hypothetical protein
MRTRLIDSSLIAITLVATNASAQADIGVSASALMSLQPIDHGYVGSPYLSEGIGGVGPGFAAGLSAIAANGLVISAEYTTARFEQEQSGRLVRGGFPLEGIPATTRLRDSLLSVLVGYARGKSTRLMFVGGLSLRLDRPTIDDAEAERYDNDDGVLPVFTGGVDVLHPLSSRTQLVISGRYSMNERDTRQQYLGVGPHIVRAGAGIRITLN